MPDSTTWNFIGHQWLGPEDWPQNLYPLYPECRNITRHQEFPPNRIFLSPRSVHLLSRKPCNMQPRTGSPPLASIPTDVTEALSGSSVVEKVPSVSSHLDYIEIDGRTSERTASPKLTT